MYTSLIGTLNLNKTIRYELIDKIKGMRTPLISLFGSIYSWSKSGIYGFLK